MARSADCQITLVLDPRDDVDTLAQLRRLHARPMGQVVCEPAPAGGTAGLARSLIAALGKNADREVHLGSHRVHLWDLVDAHLAGEGVQHLILLRAHTLPFDALRCLSDHAAAAGAHLWLVVHRERPPLAVVQLLEALPHTAASLSSLLAHVPQLGDTPPTVVPSGGGQDFPFVSATTDLYLRLVEGKEDGPPREMMVRGLDDAQRAIVDDAWETARAWTSDLLRHHGNGTYSDAADAIYLLARHADTASEIYVRVHAAAEAFHQAGLEIDIAPVDSTFANIRAERRPLTFNDAVARAAVLADQTAELQLAALIAVAVIHRDPFMIRETNRHGLAPDGSLLFFPFHGAGAIPTELRKYLITWRRHLAPNATRKDYPLFPGQSHGRLSRPAICRRLEATGAPAVLWKDPPKALPGRGITTDGRLLLHYLNPITLWPVHEWQSPLRAKQTADEPTAI